MPSSSSLRTEDIVFLFTARSKTFPQGIVFIIVGVHARVCVCVSTQVWRSEDNFLSWFSPSTLVFEAEFLFVFLPPCELQSSWSTTLLPPSPVIGAHLHVWLFHMGPRNQAQVIRLAHLTFIP